MINTKGPSASGKSTLRPLQKQLASNIGVNWSDFALISPDIWRKQLLDYDALGADYSMREASLARSCRSSITSLIATWPARLSADKFRIYSSTGFALTVSLRIRTRPAATC